MNRLIPVVLALLQGMAPSAGALESNWDPRFYNPQYLEDDRTLPTPCGGAMTFRKVVIDQNPGALRDKIVALGSRDGKYRYLQGPRRVPLAAPFAEGDGAQVYWIGKYEVTVAQHDAIAAGSDNDCGGVTLSPKTAHPKTNLSWFDAVRLTERYTSWLLKNAKSSLPTSDKRIAFARLPTEAEWEYAARGGSAVKNTEEFSAKVFPMPGGELSDYVQYQGTQSAQGKLRVIGLLKPNPLGLYDILGNAEEMMASPFRLVRPGRLHGQPGGLVMRGGSSSTPATDIATYTRSEEPMFDVAEARAWRGPMAGLRLVLAGQAIGSRDSMASIGNAYQSLTRDDEGSASADAEERALTALDAASTSTADTALRQQLEQMRSDLAEAAAHRNEQRDRAVRAMIRSGLSMCATVRSDCRRIDFAESRIGEMRDLMAKNTVTKVMRDALKRAENARNGITDQRDASMSVYVDLIDALVSDYGRKIVAPQLSAERALNETRGNQRLLRCIAAFTDHVTQRRQDGQLLSEAWTKQICRKQ